ncbi:MAG TPA: isoprenylcysteine carboxylmethyltransferase family protein [Dissulfurispiraceae bacterium]|nr:isoprenylcysteine carboxylmethyltransferase family protein [Dissulfurispiraceae bacterium]
MIMKPLIALITMMVWPVIPMFWIPAHLFSSSLKKFGRLTYILTGIAWLPVAYEIFSHRSLIFDHIVVMPGILAIAGLFMLFMGTLLHIWTGAILTPRGLIGIPEIIAPDESRLMDKGPFAVIRHPTYLAHTIMFLGVFLYTGSIAVGILTLADFTVVNAVIMPIEERELLQRFGDSYRTYMSKVPRLIPRCRLK